MLKSILTFLASMLCFGAVAMPKTDNSIKVSGVVHGILEGGSCTLIVNECDICEKSKRCIAELDSAGRFEVDLPFYFGHTFTINYDRGLFINAYARPGDSVFVSIDASESPVEFHFAGDHARLNEEYSHAFYDIGPLYRAIKLAPDTVPLSEYMPAFEGEVKHRRTVVDKYIRDRSLLPETAELLHLDNLFTIANQAIGFRGKGLDEQKAFFTDSLFHILDGRNTKVMIFPYHLSALMNRFPEYVEQVPKSVTRDLMYASLGDEVQPARNDFANPAYYDRLYGDASQVIDFSALEPGRMVVMENNRVRNVENANPVEWLKTEYASRPVYLDVSATWCGPCRASLAGSEDVRQYFKDTDVVFVVIWLKSDMESWKHLVPSIHNAVHIFIPDNDQSNRMMSTLNLKGFPSYYFIDRHGIITEENVPHFNDPNLIEFLRTKQ